MKITQAMKTWLVQNCGVKATATDEEFRKAAADALVAGTLANDLYVKLCEPEQAAPATAFEKSMAAMADGINALVKLHTPASPVVPAATPVETEKAAEPTGTKAGALAATAAASVVGGSTVVVKRAHEQYSTTKSAMLYPQGTRSNRGHALAGQPVLDFAGSDGSKTIDNPSELDKVVSGVYAKLLCATAQRGGSKTFGYQSLNEHDKDILQYALTNYKWGGYSGQGDDRYADIVNRNLSPHEQKALIDDALSGGMEAAPIVFDDDIIQIPLLHSEFFNLVKVVPLDRGRRVEGVSTGTVTGGWGGVDDSEISLFNTNAYVSAFDTTIFRWEGAIRIGLDFLSDSPINFGAHITAQYGERLLEDLDDVICTGNGTTQPEGIMNKSGATSVNFGAATTIGNYESLLFGISKAERKANLANTIVFGGTETSYQRARAIPVGASDARRLGGVGTIGGTSTYLNYTWMDHPYKVNNSLANNQIFYAILGRYRMYRRRGLTMRTSTEGDTLMRRNEMLMIAMARYGGQMERGGCVAYTSTAPT